MSLLLPKHTFEKLLQEVSVSDADMKSYIMEWKEKKRHWDMSRVIYVSFIRHNTLLFLSPCGNINYPLRASYVCLLQGQGSRETSTLCVNGVLDLQVSALCCLSETKLPRQLTVTP